MDDFDVQSKDRELDALLSEVKGLLGEDEPEREDPMEDAGLQGEVPEEPMTADDVNIDFEKFYDDAAGFPDFCRSVHCYLPRTPASPGNLCLSRPAQRQNWNSYPNITYRGFSDDNLA